MTIEQLAVLEKIWVCLLKLAIPGENGNVPTEGFVAVKGWKSFEEVMVFIDQQSVPLMQMNYKKDQLRPGVLLNAYVLTQAALLRAEGLQYDDVNVEDIHMIYD